MHKFIKSLNISLVETSTIIVLIKSFKSCSQSTVSQKNYQDSHFLPFHLFNFLTFIFFKVFSFSFQSMLRGLISDIGAGLVKASCCQITLYILHFAWFPIPNFKFNFAISTPPHPQSGDSQGQKTFLAPSANKQTCNYDTECSNHHSPYQS